MPVDPYYAITGKRPRTRYSDIVQSTLPTARENYFNKKAEDLSNSQFEQSLALQQEANDYAREQGETSEQLAWAGLGLSALPQLSKIPGVSTVTSGLGSALSNIGSGIGADTGSGLLSKFSISPALAGPLLLSAVYGDQIGEGLGKLINDPLGTISDWGSTLMNDTGEFLKNPVVSTVDSIKDVGEDIGDWAYGQWENISGGVNDIWENVTGGSWLCTESLRRVNEFSMGDIDALLKLKRYVIKEYPRVATHYFMVGHKLVDAIADRVDDIPAFYRELNSSMIRPCIEMVRAGNVDGAFRHYFHECLKVIDEFAPELAPGYARFKVQEVENA